MNRILKLNGQPVLNFADLQKEFSPLDIYAQLEAFDSFAAVHCVPLPLQLFHTENGVQTRCRANYFDKAFWQKVLRSAALRETAPQQLEQKTDAADYFSSFVQALYENKIGITKPEDRSREPVEGETIRAEMDGELADAKIYEKLKYICESGGLRGGFADMQKAVILLAICEISEQNALSVSFQSAPIEEASEEESGGIMPFPYERTAPLTARNQPYRYWYYTSDSLAQGAHISTVRIEAKAGSNHYEKVVVELYHEQSCACVQKLELEIGEFRCCNVADGRIIKLLPSVSISDDMCLIRESYKTEEISVLSPDTEGWSLNAEGISGFAAGTKNIGFLLVQNGKVNTSFYKAPDAYITRLKFDTVSLPVVEVTIEGDQYDALLADGTVISNRQAGVKQGVVSLDADSRPPLPAIGGINGAEEIARSDTKRSTAALMRGNQRKMIHFNGV